MEYCTMISLLTLLISCSDPEPQPLFLTKEFYRWECYELESTSEISVDTNTCEDRESGLHWLISEAHMLDGSRLKKKLGKTSNWHIDCLYQAKLPVIENECADVDGVTLTAYVEPATWSGALFGD